MMLLQILIAAFLGLAAAGQTPDGALYDKSISARFVSLRRASNRAHVCWAIKIAPTAFATTLECISGHNKTQLLMVYGDIQPGESEQKYLEKKFSNLVKSCRHQIENVALVMENKQSVLFKTIQNYLASYSLLDSVAQCKECSILKIKRRLNCPVKNVAIVYNNCFKHVSTSNEPQKEPNDDLKLRLDKIREQLQEGLRKHFEESRNKRQLMYQLYGH